MTVTVNPWGAYTIERDGKITQGAELEDAALVTASGWTLEAALPLSWFGLERTAGTTGIRLQTVRIRSRRPLAPEFRWYWPGAQSAGTMQLAGPVSGQGGGAPEFRPPALGNTDPPLEIGRVRHAPPIESQWDDAAWRGVPAFSLPRNEPFPRAPRYPTQVKWVQDGHTLSLHVRAEEPEPLVARTGGRDSNFATDDHFSIYLATSGSSFIEILVSTVGGIRDSLAHGARLAPLDAGWNANIKAQTAIHYGYWSARIDDDWR